MFLPFSSFESISNGFFFFSSRGYSLCYFDLKNGKVTDPGKGLGFVKLKDDIDLVTNDGAVVIPKSTFSQIVQSIEDEDCILFAPADDLGELLEAYKDKQLRITVKEETLYLVHFDHEHLR